MIERYALIKGIPFFVRYAYHMTRGFKSLTALPKTTRLFTVIHSKETAVHVSTYGGVRGRQR